MLSYDLPSLHSVTFRGRRLPRTFVAPANCAAPCDHCSIDTINYTTQGVHYASVNDDINLRFCSLTCANLCTITIWHSPRKNNFNRVCAIICVQQCSIAPGPSLYLCICVLACICVFVFLCFWHVFVCTTYMCAALCGWGSGLGSSLFWVFVFFACILLYHICAIFVPHMCVAMQHCVVGGSGLGSSLCHRLVVLHCHH